MGRIFARGRAVAKMSILEYKLFEHPGGFVGFRVSRTIGDSSVEKYFSTNLYGHAAAKEKATALNKKWRKLSQRRTRRLLLAEITDGEVQLPVIATGLRAQILAHRKYRAGEWREYFQAVFASEMPGGGTSKEFSIRRHGYAEAFRLAVNVYMQRYALPERMRSGLLSRIPSSDVFTGLLLRRVRANGYGLTKKKVLSMLADGS